ncbi:CesT family type III secretion system chaperone [Yersinia bercovieri]|uniref:CesT family type III secretion system chaperone n=1 Tax=Yersinia bercovieri TaxID=634 RepID=UPI0011A7F43B|nr:CesT family type III secretion system chaperone [Yersinia bercovieri]
MDTNNLILQEFGKILGLPLSFDKDSQCILIIERKIIISIRANEESWIFHHLLTKNTQHLNNGVFPLCLKLNIILAERGSSSVAYLPDSKQLINIVSTQTPNSGGEIEYLLEKTISTGGYIITELKKHFPFLEYLSD